jgi:dihydrofolate synthase/folylpolyglutamate synthase
MMRKSLVDWLQWQETLNPRAIDLSLDRLRPVSDRLSIRPPVGSVFTIAGTNGKGSSARFLESLMAAGGRSTAVYSSPHLVRYNERISINGTEVSDACLIDCFEAVESARRDVPLTFFEFGTLAALLTFSRAQTDVWILEVGLGGRLDAVNIIEPDYSLITTVDYDHQEWLGNSLEEIAAEKAGIMRSRAPAFFGDKPVPKAIVERADALGTRLHCLGRDFDYETGDHAWSWRGESQVLPDLGYPVVADGAQMRNITLVLAAVAAHDAALLTHAVVNQALQSTLPDGRFQVVEREHQWVLDVAHNPQAAKTLDSRLELLGEAVETTAVVSLLADKQVDKFIAALAGRVDRWIVCAVEDPRASTVEVLASNIAAATGQTATQCDGPENAFNMAKQKTLDGGRILVCGSFRIVGPALEWLGLY